MIKLFWIFLLTLSGGIGGFFLGKGLFETVGYLRLDSQGVATLNRVEVVELSPSSYTLRASYTFDARGDKYQGETQFSEGFFLNRYAAEREVAGQVGRQRQVWYQNGNPCVSSLERKSPLKNLMYGVVGAVVFLHFLKRFKQQSQEDLVEL